MIEKTELQYVYLNFSHRKTPYPPNLRWSIIKISFGNYGQGTSIKAPASFVNNENEERQLEDYMPTVPN